MGFGDIAPEKGVYSSYRLIYYDSLFMSHTEIIVNLGTDLKEFPFDSYPLPILRPLKKPISVFPMS